MKEFFGFGGYTRPAEGFMSAEHLTFVSILMLVMIASALWFGVRRRHCSEKEKNVVLIAAAIAIDVFEIFKIVLLSFREQDALHFLGDLPLYLCSIHLITMPLAAFSKGRVKEAALDFVLIFGILSALVGTYGAGNNYGTYPVLSFDNVVSGVTHALSGFASLYIVISGMAGMKKRNIPITVAILLSFGVAAFIANECLDKNYMFLVRGDGTPYDVVYQLVGGNAVLYPASVIGLFLLYIAAFYGTYFLVQKGISAFKCAKKP